MINPFKPTGLCEVSADFHLKVIMDMDIDFVAFLESTAELVKSFETDKLPFNSLYNLNGEYYGVKYEDDCEKFQVENAVMLENLVCLMIMPVMIFGLPAMDMVMVFGTEPDQKMF